MADQSIFGAEAPVVPAVQAPAVDPAPVAPVVPPVEANPLAAIVDENGRQKYETVEKALEALAHGQTYIAQLHTQVDTQKAQLAAAQTELAGKASVEDFVAQLSEQNTQPPVVEAPPASQGLDADAAAQLFDSLLTKREADSTRKQNSDAVINALKDKYGDKAEEVYLAKAVEVSLSVDELNSLSGTSPKAVLAYFGTETKAASLDVSVGSINTGAQGEPEKAQWGNYGESILMGSTAKDVRAEANRVNAMVQAVHDAGGTIEEMTDPKVYFKTFGNRK